jgi:hypothetical protein
MKHLYFFVCLLLISCGNNNQSGQSEKPIIGDSIENGVQMIEDVESKNPIIGSWKSKTYNGKKFEKLFYKIHEDSTLEGVNSKGYWSINGDQFCEKLGRKESCYTMFISNDTMILTNEIGGKFVFERTGN